jgi:hypothetical protein
MKRERLSLLLVFALVMTVLLVGCAGGDADESGSVGEATQNGEVTESGDEGGGGAWADPLDAPDGFPADIPVYPGEVLDYTSDQPNDIMTVHALQVTAPESYSDVVEWYRSGLPEGWTLDEFEEKEIGGSAKTASFWLVGNGYTREGSNVLVTVHDESPTRVLTNATIVTE